MKVEVECLQDEVVTLKTAIEEAIKKGQNSVGGLNDVPRSVVVSSKHLALTHMNAGSKVVG